MKPPKLRRNGDGRAFAVYPNANGKRAYFGTYGTAEAKRKYQAWLSGVLASISSGEPVTAPQKGRTLSDLSIDYLAFAERYYSRSREFQNVLETVSLLLSHSGEVEGDSFGPNALRAFQGHLAAQVKNGRPRFARSTVNAHVNRARRFLKWCQSRELVKPGLIQELATVDGLRKGRSPARETSPVVPVAAVVWRATLPFLPETVRDMAWVQFWCGMRPGEVCGLLPSEVDRTGEVWMIRPSKHKTAHLGRSLTKAVPPEAQGVLAPYLAGDPQAPAFRNTDGLPFTTDSYGQAIRRGARAAIKAHVPIRAWHPNQLRHSILTLIRDEHGLEAAQRWADHSRSGTTLVYTWTADAALRKLAATLGRKAG